MNIVFVIMSLLFFSLPLRAQEEIIEEKINKEKTKEEEVVIPDITTLKDPFVSRLPKVEKIETPVEQTPKTGHTITQQPVPKPPIQKQRPVLPPMRVQGIILGGDVPQAIINDTVVTEGEDVQGAKVRSIQKNGINLVFQGENFHVSMDQ